MTVQALIELCARRVAGVMTCLFAVACVGGQSTDDFRDRPCVPVRMPVVEADAALQAALARLEGSYEIGGRWGSPSAQLRFAPADATFHGQLEIVPASGPLIQLSGCGLSGIEVPVGVSLHTDDGALEETVSGTAVLRDLGFGMTVDGSPAPCGRALDAGAGHTLRGSHVLRHAG
jgi:hypothetical protein